MHWVGPMKIKPVGSCSYSSACVFSLHAIKSMTTGAWGCVYQFRTVGATGSDIA